MTIHNSKGLEFPIVFLVGFENEIFPGARASFDEKEMEEERRLCYVALTRAEKKLYLSHTAIRFVYGQDRLATPSIFLKEIPEKLLDVEVKKERLYFEDDEFSDNDIELLDEVIKSFGNKTAKELVAYTHNEESLWNKTAKENKVLNLLENETINSTNLYLNLADLVADDPRKKAIYEDYTENVSVFPLIYTGIY